jgi:hypothetical protein
MLPAVPDRRRFLSRPTDAGLTRLAATTTASAAILGVAVGVGEHSAILGVVFAAVGAGVRLAVATWQRLRTLPVDSIDPFAVPEPWRDLVQQAVDADKRFHEAVRAWPPGPLRDRLASLEPSIDAQVQGVWVAARQGATISGGYPAGLKRPTAEDLSAELEAVQLERTELRDADRARRQELDRAEQALAAQLQSARRAISTADAVSDRLRTLVAQLDGAVVSVVSLTATPGGAADIEGAVGTIQGLAQEIAALQAGMGEAAQLPGGAGPSTGTPTPPATS